MSGVRLHHPSLRSCTYTLIHMGRPMKGTIVCPACHLVHDMKTYHLALDAVGDVVVSETVYERLKEAGLDELKVLREVKKPEPMVLDMNERSSPIVISRENGHQPVRKD